MAFQWKTKHTRVAIVGLFFLVGSGVLLIWILTIAPFKLELLDSHDHTNSPIVRHCKVQLDSDPFHETIFLKETSGERPVATISILDTVFLSEHILPGKWLARRDFFDLIDTDGDGVREVVCFTHEGSALWATFVNFPKNSLHSVFVDSIDTGPGVTDILLQVSQDPDNLYGDSECIISVNAGYGLHPRKVYRYDAKQDTFLHTRDPGSKVLSPILFDVDRDRSPEVLTRSFAPENIHHEVPYTDSSAWLRVFDMDLNHLFPPVEYKYQTSQTNVYPYRTDSANYIALTHTYGGPKRVSRSIALYDQNGSAVIERRFPESRFSLLPINDLLLIYDYNNRVLHNSNEQLEMGAILHENLNPLSWMDLSFKDLDGDGELEVISWSDNHLTIISGDAQNVYYEIVPGPINQLYVSYDGVINLSGKGPCYSYQYTPNTLFPFRWWLTVIGVLAMGLLAFVSSRLNFLHSRSEPRPLPSSRELIIAGKDKIVKISYSEILFLEAAGGPYTDLYMVSGEKHLIVKTIGDVQKDLDEAIFLRISRKYVVNTQFVLGLNKQSNTVIIKHHGQPLEYAKNRRKELEEILSR